MDDKKDCKLVGDGFAAQTANLNSVTKSVGGHKNPIVKPLPAANSNIKHA